MTKSMTGFAAAKGEAQGYSWTWDIRSVNAKGLDVRMRVPDWIEGLEAAVRPIVQKAAARGNINLSLRVQSDGDSGGIAIDPTGLDRALEMISQIESAAQHSGVALTPATAADILTVRGVMDTTGATQDTGPLLKAIVTELPALLKAFNAMRATEGTALHKVLTGQFEQIAVLTEQAVGEAEKRKDQMAQNLRQNLARVLENADGADADRVAQELAMITVKTDVTEEIDRLRAHVSAANDLLASAEPVGRKLDFLSQEFNREANTLCSKAQSTELTRIGLDLKAVIDQMREQVQNVE